MSDELSVFAKKRKRKKLIRTVFVSCLVLALLGVGGYFALTKYLVVSEVSIQETSLYPAEELLAAAAPEKGTPLVQVSKKEISRSIEENFPYLVDVKVEFDLPGRIVVHYTEDFGEISVALGKELYCVDKDLNVLAKESVDSQIPRIRLISGDVSRCIVGEKLGFFESEAAQQLQTILLAMEETDIMGQVQMIDARDKFNIKIRYLDRFDLLMGDVSNMKHKFLMVKEVSRDLAQNQCATIDIADPDTAYVKLGETLS